MAKTMNSIQAGNIDEYIACFPKDVQKLLKEIRAAIRKGAPAAEEAIKYGLPTLVMEGNLVHFGAFKNHIGFYPAPSGIEAYKKELSVYESSKGAIRFPFDKPLPLALVTRIVKFRVMENLEKAKAKRKK
jgi:uncharacterized protein YdhG (YjbR/CyaY superfamily)